MATDKSQRGTSFPSTAAAADIANAVAAGSNANSAAGRANSAADRIEAIEPNLLYLIAVTDTAVQLGGGDDVVVTEGTNSQGFPTVQITFGS